MIAAAHERYWLKTATLIAVLSVYTALQMHEFTRKDVKLA